MVSKRRIIALLGAATDTYQLPDWIILLFALDVVACGNVEVGVTEKEEGENRGGFNR